MHHYTSLMHWYFGQTAHTFEVYLYPVVTAVLILKCFSPSLLAPAFLNACLDLQHQCFCFLVLWCQIAHHKVINSNLLEVEEVLRSKIVVSLAFSVPLSTKSHLRVVVLSTLEVVLCSWEEHSIPYTHNGKIILGNLKDQSRGFNWEITEDGNRTYLRTGTCKFKPIHLLWVTFRFFPDIICIVAYTKRQFSCGMVQAVKNVNCRDKGRTFDNCYLNLHKDHVSSTWCIFSIWSQCIFLMGEYSRIWAHTFNILTCN